MREDTEQREAATTVQPAPAGWLGFRRLQREERKSLLARVEPGARTDVDFLVMMFLSVGLAGFGLLQGSTAVVIGAMLVAPLMGPLLAAGLSLAQANATLFRRSMTTTVVGIGVAFAVSVGIGLLNPGYEPSLEIEARGAPDILDLGIALLAGMAAAWSLGRTNLSGTLAGVAIAGALVPPLVVVGIALTNHQPRVAVYSAVLVTTNVVAIILGATATFFVLGAHAALGGKATPSWVRRIELIMMIAILALTIPLMERVRERGREGDARPLTYPVAARTREAVREFMRDWPEFRLLFIGRFSVEPHTGITVALEADAPVPATFDRALKAVIRIARKEDVPVHVFALQGAWAEGNPDRESRDPDSADPESDR